MSSRLEETLSVDRIHVSALTRINIEGRYADTCEKVSSVFLYPLRQLVGDIIEYDSETHKLVRRMSTLEQAIRTSPAARLVCVLLSLPIALVIIACAIIGAIGALILLGSSTHQEGFSLLFTPAEEKRLKAANCSHYDTLFKTLAGKSKEERDKIEKVAEENVARKWLGEEYDTLSPAERESIDNIIETKVQKRLPILASKKRGYESATPEFRAVYEREIFQEFQNEWAFRLVFRFLDNDEVRKQLLDPSNF